MKTNPLRKLYNNRVFWVIVSLLASLAIWVYVMSGESTELRKVFSNVQLELVGEESLRSSRELVITDLNTTTVSVEIIGPRKIIGVLDSRDLTAQVDVSRITQAGATSMKYEIVYPSGTDTRNITEVTLRPSTVNFVVSKLTTNTVPVRGGFEGSLADGYMAETPVFEPSTVTVTGPELYVKDIDHAWVTFGKDIEVSTTYSVETGFTLMDADGKPCPTENISFTPDTVKASLPILESKEVSLGIDIIAGAGATSANTVIKVEPSSIILAGDSAILSGINRIILDTVNLSSFVSTYSETYTIPINNDLQNVTGISEAKVTIEIVGLETASYQVKNISCVNVADGMEVDVLTENIDVMLRGTAEQLAQVKSENIRAVADLADFKDSTGAYMPAVKIYVDGVTDVGAVGENTISVEIRKG